MEATKPRKPYGREVGFSPYNPLREMVDVDRSPAGNLILRIYRENEEGGSISQIAHVVLLPDEEAAFLDDVDGFRGEVPQWG